MIIANYLLYYLVIIPISLLPFKVLYGISDLMYVLFYRVIGYRKKVVVENIQKSFPGKTAEERKEIAKKFYHHFCDLIVESLKIFTISESQIHERMICKNPELINKYFDQNKSVIIAGGHINNWELFAVAIDDAVKHQTIGIYKPLTNKFFDDKMKKTRSKYGLRMISTKIVSTVFEEEKNNLTATIFATDQSPSNPNNCYWTTFLNQDTGVPFGTEKFSRQYNMPVIYGRINKEKRGHYTFEFLTACDNPQQTAPGEITENITQLIEKNILEAPEFWLWSHRRWKHKRP